MYAEENKAIAARYAAVWNRHDLDAAVAFPAPDCIVHFPAGSEPVPLE